MSGRTKFIWKQRLEAVEMCLSGDYSYITVAKKFNTRDSTLRNWISSYKNNGVDGLQESHTWRKYPLELKLAAVNDYLSRKFSLSECCDKYNISSNSVLRKWISKYNSGKELKATNGGSTRMKAGRKTTFEERLEIALYAIEHGKNYSATAKKYNVSYQQVHNWVKKYLSKGENGLKDNRGKRIENRDKAELTDTEKVELKLKEAEDRIRRLEAENFMLKKLHEFQRRSIK
ncbi:transposase [Ligilactobacillus salivarius]|uniref:Helix-turn-helix domain-containing protein n=4 Tax=Ligilactobacillus salivarius TaxID=1624 RepID=A0AAX3X8Q7_9LACO|nr:helix-turn-helix domain-containing protein [Ligilactobacillus salivarius]MCF2623728.1 transposase [Ligilactobacillus salivarius]MDH4960185.1 helix-turn-helix domain-containing protein [Ligilactobacillus salivarius]MDY5246299.1 helix-turn-helix domain-containing protein [Ligilactobacillus salivarius]PAY47059.1 transposase [Ligilactobacillus salivarius]PAY52997.1 transposase [Ligilactobacillus salivarius]